MPELPEVERARKLIHDSCKGYKIIGVDAKEDKIVFCGGTDHLDFGKEIQGRTIEGCERRGKHFWLLLSGQGRLPVMHFGMTGMIQLKGQEPTWYRRRPKERTNEWPPKFYKFILKLLPQPGSAGSDPRELAFIDARRLGRVRLLPTPVLSHPPLSELGFDPILDHPSLSEFKKLITKKKGTVKGLIMDQAFSAGVGNWVADEVLYQAKIHPACPVPQLSEQNVIDLHHQLRNVPLTAVGVNADSTQFPEGWLFRWRWDKGKKKNPITGGIDQDAKKSGRKGMRFAMGAVGRAKTRISKGEGGGGGLEEEMEGEDVKPKGLEFMTLPDGRPATITFIEVGGRTTAVVDEVQKMPEGVEIKPKLAKGGKASPGRNGGKKRKNINDGEDLVSEEKSDSSLTDIEEDEKPSVKVPAAASVATTGKVEKTIHSTSQSFTKTKTKPSSTPPSKPRSKRR